jgi:hypothetical protein
MEKNNEFGDSRTVGAAKGAVTRFTNTRGVKGGPKRPVASGEPAKPKKKKPATAAKAAAKPKKAATPAATRGGAIVRSPGGAIVPTSRAMPAAKPAAPKKPKSRPASGRKIDDAKARRIVSRIEARRPNLRPASESRKRTMLSTRTYDRASDFILGPTMRSIKKGKGALGVVESTKRAVANATKPRKTAKKR